MLDIQDIRTHFPILDQEVFGHPLVYLDNAATMQVPEPVIAALERHYHADNANVHRGIHALSERSTRALEAARKRVQEFLNARSSDEIVFTSGTTGSLNMLADMWAREMKPGSCVVVTMMEHHANFVPWQQMCQRAGCKFVAAPLTDEGEIDLVAFKRLISKHEVSLVSVTHVSNVLGTVNPVGDLAEIAHAHGAVFVVDAAQSVRHEHVDVRDINCDFLAFSGHKMGAPTGIGVLYGKAELLERLQPARFGGEMVGDVRVSGTTFEAPPLRFEAGTPNYVGAIGLAAAIDYLQRIGHDDVCAREHHLISYAEDRLNSIDGLHILGNPTRRAGCLSFTVDGVHPFDLATLVDKLGVALRSGNQCAQPLLYEAFHVHNITRMSPAFYNTEQEIDQAVAALERVIAHLRA